MTEQPDPEQSAAEAGLRYVTDSSPGITRHRAGKGFYYRNAKGDKVVAALTDDELWEAVEGWDA